MLFNDFFSQPEKNSNAMVMIFLGCVTFGLFIAYIYTKWAQISTAITGAKEAAVIGLFIALFSNFFNFGNDKRRFYPNSCIRRWNRNCNDRYYWGCYWRD